jgi:condensin complex subunit 3
MPAQLSDEEKRSQLCISVCKIFEQAGNSVASHGKNFVALYKIHIDLAEFTESFKKGKRELFKLVGEKDFQDTFKGILTKIFPLKKGETIGDRVIKFVGGFVKYANEKGQQSAMNYGNELHVTIQLSME